MNQSSIIPLIKPLYRLYFNIVDQPNRIASNGLLIADKPLWRDVSSHQGEWDADVSAQNGVQGVFIRASYGLIKDTRFPINYAKASNTSMFRSSYHALYPNLSQHPTIEGVPRVLDVEIQGGVSNEKIGWDCWDLSRVILSRDGIRPIFYSRTNLINLWFALWDTNDLDNHFWWLAQYLSSGAEHPGPYNLPNRVSSDRVLIIQTSSHKPDFPGEAESLSIDWNRWELGNKLQMLTWIQDNWHIGSPQDYGSWYTDIDLWARTQGFSSPHIPPGG